MKNVFYSKRLSETIEDIIYRLNEKKILTYKYINCVYRIHHGSIVYIEKMTLGRKCLIVTLKGNTFEAPFSITELHSKLGTRFRQTHQSCIINIDKVEKIDYKNQTIYFIDNLSTDLLSSKYKMELDDYVRSI